MQNVPKMLLSSGITQNHQDTLAFEARFQGYAVAGKTLQKGNHYAFPFRCLKTEGKTTWLPLILTMLATSRMSANNIGYIEFASRTIMSFCHTTNLT